MIKSKIIIIFKFIRTKYNTTMNLRMKDYLFNKNLIFVIGR